MRTPIERVIRDFTAQPLAILPDKLEEIQSFIQRRHEMKALDTEELQALVSAAARPRQNAAGGVAVLPLHGVLFHRADALRESSGGMSAERFAAQVRAAAEDESVREIIIDVNSPGGSVAGIAEAAAAVFEARKRKRITAVANSMMASAAYWIASAAHEIVGIPSAMVGSIGVVYMHTEFSKMEEQLGVKTTVITSGDFKAEANPYEPLTDEARAAIQETNDEFYRQFTEAVARHRGTTVETVQSGYGRGRALPARQALQEGLIDRIESFDAILGSRGLTAQPANLEASELPAEHTAIAEGAPGDVPEASIESPINLITQPAPEARETQMSDKDTAAQKGAAIKVGEDRAAERKRATDIAQICSLHGVADRTGSYIEAGMTAAEVGCKLGEEAQAQLRAMSAPAVELTEKESRQYSISRAIMAQAEHGEGWTGFEREISDEIAAKLPSNYKSHGGAFVPTTVPAFGPSAALNSGTTTAGGDLVFTERGQFIDLLRGRMQVVELGATVLSGLNGPVAFPKQTGAGTFNWVAENPGSDVTNADATFAQVALNPQTGQASTSFSRQLLIQGLPDVDAMVQNDLAQITALGIDAAAINGSGSNNQPTGILNTSGIGAVAMGTNGGQPTFAAMIDLETAVAVDNADIGVMAYLTHPTVRGTLKKTEEFADSNGRPVWTGGMQGEVNGYRAAVSTQVPSDLTKGSGTGLSAVIFGVWSELLLGYWGAFELVVDPYSLKRQGLIEVTSFQMAGVAVRHAEAFAAIKDAGVAGA